jgi:hypothetical protein
LILFFLLFPPSSSTVISHPLKGRRQL